MSAKGDKKTEKSAATATPAAAASAPVRPVRPVHQGWRSSRPHSRPDVSSFLQTEIVKNRDAHARMNFLYQAANFYAQFNPPPDNSQYSPNRALSRFYLSSLKKISSRLVMRIHSNVKNTACKTCGSMLVAGINQTNENQNQVQDEIAMEDSQLSAIMGDSAASSEGPPASPPTPALFGGTCTISLDPQSFSHSPLLRRHCLACGESTVVNVKRDVRLKKISTFRRQARKKRKAEKKRKEKEKKNKSTETEIPATVENDAAPASSS